MGMSRKAALMPAEGSESATAQIPNNPLVPLLSEDRQRQLASFSPDEQQTLFLLGRLWRIGRFHELLVHQSGQ